MCGSFKLQYMFIMVSEMQICIVFTQLCYILMQKNGILTLDICTVFLFLCFSFDDPGYQESPSAGKYASSPMYFVNITQL